VFQLCRGCRAKPLQERENKLKKLGIEKKYNLLAREPEIIK
jgi:hypothetical protein